ncbi:HK97 gp10 family phage protein [Escherichia coli]|uniref:HK97 gp10 family phage protein n=1 Tax=Escherichia coli TaxID=562 RepID=UPI000AE1E088|nr:HK97 gp10 family phage protein [Escherichia coli]
MGIKVRGVKQSKAGLNRIINDVKGRKVVRALQSAMIIGSSQAALYTPIDTSTLLNSQYRELINNGVRLTGRVGYTANYAVFVHDPNLPQTFRRATAQKEFLTKGFEDTRSQIDAVMRKELSV